MGIDTGELSAVWKTGHLDTPGRVQDRIFCRCNEGIRCL